LYLKKINEDAAAANFLQIKILFQFCSFIKHGQLSYLANKPINYTSISLHMHKGIAETCKQNFCR